MRVILFAAFLAAAAQASAQQPAALSEEKEAPTSVEELTVRAPTEVPIPDVGEGAPNYSVTDLLVLQRQPREKAVRLMRARIEISRAATPIVDPDEKPIGRATDQDLMGGSTPERRMNLALMLAEDSSRSNWRSVSGLGQAINATRTAELIRKEAARGLRTQAEVEAAELARQAAVRAAFRQTRRAPDLASIPPRYAPIALESLRASTMGRGAQTRMVVSGVLRNTSPQRMKAPLLIVTGLDQAGFILASQTLDLDIWIEPGRARSFVYQLASASPNVKNVRVEMK